MQKLSFRNLLIFIFPVLALTNCKPAPKPVSEEEAYLLFNELIFDDTLVMKEVCESFETVDFNNEMKKSLTLEEFQFLQKQQMEIKIKKFKPNKIAYFHKGYKKGDFVELITDCSKCEKISFPLITPDRKKLSRLYTIVQKTHLLRNQYYQGLGSFNNSKQKNNRK